MLRKISNFFNSTFKKVDDVNNDDSIYVHGIEDVYNQRFKKIKISNVLQKAYNYVIGKIEEDEVIENAIDAVLEEELETLVDGALTELTPSLKTDIQSEILSNSDFLAAINDIVNANIPSSSGGGNKSHILSLEQGYMFNDFININDINFNSKILHLNEYNKMFIHNLLKEKYPFIISFYEKNIIIQNIVNDEENINVLKRDVYNLSDKIEGAIQKICINTNDYTKSIIVFINTNNKMCITKLNNIYDEDSEWTYIETNLSSIMEVKYSSKYNSFILVGKTQDEGFEVPTVCIVNKEDLSLEYIYITENNYPDIYNEFTVSSINFEKLIIDAIDNDVVMTLRMTDFINIRCVVIKVIENENVKTLDLIMETPSEISQYEIFTNQPLLYEIGPSNFTKYYGDEGTLIKKHILHFNTMSNVASISPGRIINNKISIIYCCKLSVIMSGGGGGVEPTCEFGIYEIQDDEIINFEKVEATQILSIKLFSTLESLSKTLNLYNLNILYRTFDNNVLLKTVKW